MNERIYLTNGTTIRDVHADLVRSTSTERTEDELRSVIHSVGVQYKHCSIVSVAAAWVDGNGEADAQVEGDAIEAGRAWAEREVEALELTPRGPWKCSASDARPLFDGADEDRIDSMLEAANLAAAARWEALTA